MSSKLLYMDVVELGFAGGVLTADAGLGPDSRFRVLPAEKPKGPRVAGRLAHEQVTGLWTCVRNEQQLTCIWNLCWVCVSMPCGACGHVSRQPAMTIEQQQLQIRPITRVSVYRNLNCLYPCAFSSVLAAGG